MILSEKRTYRAIFALVLLIAALTRFIDLGFKSFWIDEGTTAFIIRGTFESFLHPPGYFILARPLLKIFGQSDYTFRLLPAISGWLTILFIMLLSGELFKESRYRNLITIMAGAVAAVNPYMVAMSQENRMYCLIALFAVSSSYYLCKAINNELGYDKSKYSPWLWWALYSIIIIYGTYTHVFTFTILAAGNIFLLCLVVFGKLPIKFWRYIIVQAIIFAAYIPLAFNTIGHIATRERALIITVHNLNPFYYIYNLTRTLATYSIGYTFSAPGHNFREILQIDFQTAVYLFISSTLIIIAISISILGLFYLKKEKLKSHPILFAFIFIFIVLFIALTMDNSLPRQLPMGAPFFYIIIIGGISMIKGKFKITILTALLVGNILLYFNYAKTDTIPYSNLNWRNFSVYLNENVPPKDIVLVFLGARDGYYTLKYYECTAQLMFPKKPHMREDMPEVIYLDEKNHEHRKSDSEVVKEVIATYKPDRVWCVIDQFRHRDMHTIENSYLVDVDFGFGLELLVVNNPNNKTNIRNSEDN